MKIFCNQVDETNAEKLDKNLKNLKKDLNRENIGYQIREAALRTIKIDKEDKSSESESSISNHPIKKRKSSSSRSSNMDIYYQEMTKIKKERTDREEMVEKRFEEEMNFKRKQLELDRKKLDLEEIKVNNEAQWRLKEQESRDAKDLAMINAFATITASLKKN